MRLFVWRRTFLLTLASLILNAVAAQEQGQILIPAGSEWRYDSSGTDLGISWREASYADVGWATGVAQLGYGDGDEATVISYGQISSDKYPCYYFRQTFSVLNPGIYESLSLDVLRDDGCVVYLNGTEIARRGMPSGTIAYATYATSAEEYDWDLALPVPNLLLPGANVLAVEVHQGNATSSDLSFDLVLRGLYSAPVVALVDPADNAVSSSADVAFTIETSDPTGLAAATLVVVRPPLTLTFSGPAETDDTEIRATEPGTNLGDALSINVDGENPHAHGLLQFPGVIGSQPGQLPLGTPVLSAELRIYCTNPGNPISLFRLTESWDANVATWNDRSTGYIWSNPGADGQISHALEELVGDCSATGWRTIDVTRIVQAWSDDESNYGFVLTDGGTDGVDFDSSESANPPALIITYGGETVLTDRQALSGTSATVQFSATLSDNSEYLWNCAVENTSGLLSYAPADHRLTIDSHYPVEPTAIYPENGEIAVPVSPALTVNVVDPDANPMEVNFYGRGGDLNAEAFTIIALPDSQKYVVNSSYAPIFTKQTQWIVDQSDNLNIVFVTHEGDICDTYNSVAEHDYAWASLSLLDGVVPYGLLPGNHDQPTTLYNNYWPFSKYAGEDWYGGHYPTTGNDNNFELFTAGGIDFLILHLQFNPSSEVIAWADSTLKAHPHRKAIITTHGFLDVDGDRDVSIMGSTQYIWDALVVPNDNVYFVLCGHMHGEYTRTDSVNGRQVHQLLADYQEYPEGGQGWLRVMRFVPAENQVHVQTYSPHLNSYQQDADSEFSLDFPMDGFAALGTVTAVPSGDDAQWVWADLEAGATYEWYVSATDTTGRTTFSPVWQFTTGSDDTQAPTISDVMTSGESENSVVLTWTTDEPATSVVDYFVGEQNAGQVLDLALTTTHSVLLSALEPATLYGFSVSSADAVGNSAVAAGFSFTTLAHNETPTATPQSVTLFEDQSIQIVLSAVDGDSDPSTLVYIVATFPQFGGLTGIAPDLTYTPAPDFDGNDSFMFTVSDGNSVSEAALVAIEVTPVNDPPVANPGFDRIADAGMPVILDGSASYDVDGDALTYQWLAISGPAVTLADTDTHKASFTAPTVDAATLMEFELTVSDGQYSDTATVGITVQPAVFQALVVADPFVTYGSLVGDAVTATHTLGDGITQTVSESSSGKAGRAKLDVEYPLQTSVPDDLIVGLELYLGAEWTFDPAIDPLQVMIRNGSSWENISAPLLSEGVFTVVSAPRDYVDPDGYILVRFTDSFELKGETKDALTIDLLYATIKVGTPDLEAPEAPQSLSATVQDLQVSLDWTANSESDLAGYIVFRAANPDGPYEQLNFESTATPSYTDVTPMPGDYSYTIQAVDSSGNVSPASQAIQVTTTSPSNSVHVQGVTVRVVPDGRVAQAMASVTVTDLQGVSVGEVGVVGDWYFKGSLVENGVSALTDDGGVAAITSQSYRVKSGNEFRFVVTDLIATGYSYDPSLNVVSEGAGQVP